MVTIIITIGFIALAALTAWAYWYAWKDEGFYEIGVPDESEIRRHGDRTQITRSEPGWYIDANGILTRGEM